MDRLASQNRCVGLVARRRGWNLHGGADLAGWAINL
jgi:hypothetical protein